MKEKSMNVLFRSMLLCIVVVAAGCEMRPGLPRRNGKIENIIRVESAGEKERAQTLVDAKQEYYQSLAALGHYYVSKGVELKRIWSEREQKNLSDSMIFTFEGLSDPLIKPSPYISKTDEATLVEMTVSARKKFKDAVDELSLYYTGANMVWHAAMIDSIRNRFDIVRTYAYFMDAEVPPADLKPDQVIADAEDLFSAAVRQHEKGWFLIFPTSKPDQRQALLKFQDLISKYPSSKRIAESAYYIGLIYSRAFGEYYRAMTWYDRAVRWDPELALPARYEAALIADKKIRNATLALDLYTKVVKTSNVKRHVEYASQRIEQLNR